MSPLETVVSSMRPQQLCNYNYYLYLCSFIQRRAREPLSRASSSGFLVGAVALTVAVVVVRALIQHNVRTGKNLISSSTTLSNEREQRAYNIKYTVCSSIQQANAIEAGVGSHLMLSVSSLVQSYLIPFLNASYLFLLTRVG